MGDGDGVGSMWVCGHVGAMWDGIGSDQRDSLSLLLLLLLLLLVLLLLLLLLLGVCIGECVD